MTAQVGPNDLARLREYWRRWTAVVELFARRRARRRRVGEREYHALHASLLAACRLLASREDANGQVFFEGLVNLAQPWLTPEAMDQANREVLLDVLDRCRQAGRQLGVRTWPEALGRWLTRLVALVAFLVPVCLGLWYADQLWAPVQDRLDDWWRLLVLGVQRVSYMQGLIGGGIILVLIAIIVSWRSTGRM